MTKTTARAICHECVTTNAPPARPSMRKISSGAYATDESASLAKIGQGETLRQEGVAEPVAPHGPAEDEALENAPGVRHARNCMTHGRLRQYRRPA